VTFPDEFLPRHEFGDAVGAGADGGQREGLEIVVFQRVRIAREGFDVSLGQDEGLLQVQQGFPQRFLALGVNAYGEITHLFRPVEVGQTVAHADLVGREGRLEHAVQREHHVVGGHGFAVVEHDALAQFQLHRGGRDEGPLGGETGAEILFDVGIIPVDQRVEGIVVELRTDVGMVPAGIEVARHVAGGDGQVARGGGACQNRGEGGGNHQVLHRMLLSGAGGGTGSALA